MSGFDADAYMETLEVPTVIIKGKKYKGIIMSFDQYVPFYDRMAKFTPEAIEEMTDLEKVDIGVEYEKLKIEFLRVTFPNTLFRKNPVGHLMRLPRAAQDEAFGCFFSQTGVALGLLSPKKTSGMNSQKLD